MVADDGWEDLLMRPSAFVVVLALVGLIPVAAHAAGNGSLDVAIYTFTRGAASIQGVTEAAGQNLFAALASIDIVWNVGWATATGAGVAEVLALTARQMIGIGFFWWLLTNGAGFANAIIRSFSMVGGQAAGAAGGVVVMGPTDIFNAGVNVAHGVWQGMTWDHPLMGILLVIAGLIVLLVFARIVGMIIEVLVESAIMTYAGLILLGFGGTSFTREFAISYYRFCISVGMKRMILQVLVGLGTGYITLVSANIQAGISPGWDTICYLIALPLVMWQLCEKLPYRAQDLINGAISHGGTSMASTAVMVSSAVGQTVLAGSGASAAAVSAGRLAAQQTGPSSGGVGGAMSAGARFAGLTAANLGTAAGRDFWRSMTGQPGSHHGSAGWRMAADMASRVGPSASSGAGAPPAPPSAAPPSGSAGAP